MQEGQITALCVVQYNALGAKMAPLFKPSLLDDLPADRKGSRDFIYDLYEEYECEKAQLVGYDLSDAVHYIYQQLDQHRHHDRTPVHSIFVDETQDFTQAELALFLRVAEDKNDLFFRSSPWLELFNVSLNVFVGLNYSMCRLTFWA